MDTKEAEGDGGDARNGSAKGSSEQMEQATEQSQQQQLNPMFPYMMPPGGLLPGMIMPDPRMMGGGMQEMLEDIMAMTSSGGYGPPPGFNPSGLSSISPPWMMSVNGSSNHTSVGSAADNLRGGGGKQGKKSKKDEQAASLVKRRAKRSRLNNDAKNATTTESTEPEMLIELMSDSWKKTVLEKFPRCKSAEGIRDTSYFVTTTKGQSMAADGGAGMGRYVSPSARRAAASRAATAVGGLSNIQCLRKLLSELNRMEYEDKELLPGGTAPIWLRYDDECPQYMRAIVTGPPRDTPYSNGLFIFDIYVPDSYPQVSPKVQLLTTGGGSVRFGPNLYADGKVCLSLLGTWSGPKWDPQQSSISQILVSIQGLILGVEHPYYLEPGYGGWEASHASTAATMAHGGPPPAASSGTAKGGGAVDGSSGGAQKYIPPSVKTYEDKIRMGTLKHAIGDYCTEITRSNSSARASTSAQHYLSAFEDILQAHFWNRKECIKADAKKWIRNAHSQHQKKKMQMVLKEVELALERLEEPSLAATEATMLVSTGAAAASTLDGNVSANCGKTEAFSTDGSSISPEMADKHREMEAAAAKGDYILAGRIQSQINLSGKVAHLIASKTTAMEDAVAKKDYVEAGRLQLIVRHLESNKMRLQDLEKRMFEYAAKLDFVKAGRFQEQYRVLMESAEADTASSGAASKATPGTLPGLAGVVASALGGAGGKMPLVMYGGPGDYDDYYGGDYPDEYGDY